MADETTESQREGVSEADADNGEQPAGQEPQDAPAEAVDDHDVEGVKPDGGPAPEDDQRRLADEVDQKGDEVFVRHFEVPGPPEIWEHFDHTDNCRAVIVEAINKGHRVIGEVKVVAKELVDRGFGHLCTVLRYEAPIVPASEIGAASGPDDKRDFRINEQINPRDLESNSTGGVLSYAQRDALAAGEEPPEDRPGQSVHVADNKIGHENWVVGKGEPVATDKN